MFVSAAHAVFCFHSKISTRWGEGEGKGLITFSLFPTSARSLRIRASLFLLPKTQVPSPDPLLGEGQLQGESCLTLKTFYLDTASQMFYQFFHQC